MGAARSSLSSGMARRLDRLSVAAHRFHRIAHHPLCEEYASEVFLLGRKTRICKGCTLAGLGAAVGLVVGGFASLLPGWGFVALASGLGPLLTVAVLLRSRRRSAPQSYQGGLEPEALSASHHLPNSRGKLLPRFLPAAMFAGAILQGLRMGGATGYVGAILAAGQLALILGVYRRHGPQRLPCQTCPERFEMNRCRGFKEILRRERAFQRLAGRMIHGAAIGAMPPTLETAPHNRDSGT